jgi:hypothetical protein
MQFKYAGFFFVQLFTYINNRTTYYVPTTTFLSCATT